MRQRYAKVASVDHSPGTQMCSLPVTEVPSIVGAATFTGAATSVRTDGLYASTLSWAFCAWTKQRTRMPASASCTTYSLS